MTSRKHLKQLVRERQQKTGESYTAALAQLRQPRPAVEATEQPEVTRWAREAGLRCQAFVTPGLWGEEAALGPPEQRFLALFQRLRELLQALRGEPGGRVLARALLDGAPGTGPLPTGLAELFGLQRFLEAVRAGARGVSASGRAVAFDVPRGSAQATLTGFWLGLPAAPGSPPREQVLWLSPFSPTHADPLSLATWGLLSLPTR